MVGVFLADESVREGQIKVIESHLPPGWSLVDRPEGATAILTQNQDVSEEILRAAGDSLQLIVRLDIGQAGVAPH
jgi:hypothetical protein